MDIRMIWGLFWASKVGAATASFLRVSVATAAAAWMQAGLPIADLTSDVALHCIELGLQAGATLVIVNYFGPWEQRYGVTRKG